MTREPQAPLIVLGIDPGLAHTGWGVIAKQGPRVSCLAYGVVTTHADEELSSRLKKIHDQISLVIDRYHPAAVGIETVWFGVNVSSAFATGQARGAALVACAAGGLAVGDFEPRLIKKAVVGSGSAEKNQVQYMMQQILKLDRPPSPDHAADALAAALCFTVYGPTERTAHDLVSQR